MIRLRLETPEQRLPDVMDVYIYRCREDGNFSRLIIIIVLLLCIYDVSRQTYRITVTTV